MPLAYYGRGIFAALMRDLRIFRGSIKPQLSDGFSLRLELPLEGEKGNEALPLPTFPPQPVYRLCKLAPTLTLISRLKLTNPIQFMLCSV